MKKAARELGIPVQWGGDWRTFFDGPHFQLPRKQYPESGRVAGGSRAHAYAKAMIRPGDHGSAVKAVQEHLNITADGIFGPQTRKAVLAFQKSHGLVPDGIVGVRTRKAMGL